MFVDPTGMFIDLGLLGESFLQTFDMYGGMATDLGTGIADGFRADKFCPSAEIDIDTDFSAFVIPVYSGDVKRLINFEEP
jgi:hypothetical protein